MKALSKSIVALSVALTALGASVAQANDLAGKCSAGVGKINVVGSGEVKVMPDQAELNYRVSSVKDTADAARSEVEKSVSAFAKEVEALKLGEKAFVADNLSISPRYQWNEKERRQNLVGYEAVRNVQIKIKDFGLIAKINDSAIKSGINQVAGFVYSVEDRKKYELEAAQKAIADAKERAQLLASGFEVEVGSPCSLNFQQQGAVAYRAAPRAAMLSADAGGAQNSAVYSIEPIVISSSVEASFAIKD